MARRQRRFTVFSLSFLDIMSCGFGATVLVFMLIHHSTVEHSDEVNKQLLIEVETLRKEIVDSEMLVTQARTEIQMADEAIVELEARTRQLLDQTAQARDELADQDETTLAEREHVAALIADIQSLEEQTKRLEGAAEEQRLSHADARSFLGAGDRQYLTGLKLGGRRILIMLDSSASMLDAKLVNIIRRRNMPLERKVEGRKWQRSLKSVEWIIANMPETSDYQVYTFNETAQPLIAGSDGTWFPATDLEQVSATVAALGTVDPGNGTSLHNAFAAIKDMDPMPDNVILITDGLPTIGDSPTGKRTITARNRLRLYRRSLQELPFGIPVNIILLPLEGDPEASSQFWRLAMISGGSFMSPSRDWP